MLICTRRSQPNRSISVLSTAYRLYARIFHFSTLKHKYTFKGLVQVSIHENICISPTYMHIHSNISFIPETIRILNAFMHSCIHVRGKQIKDMFVRDPLSHKRIPWTLPDVIMISPQQYIHTKYQTPLNEVISRNVSIC